VYLFLFVTFALERNSRDELSNEINGNKQNQLKKQLKRKKQVQFLYLLAYIVFLCDSCFEFFFLFY